jgi:hypothetical protein
MLDFGMYLSTLEYCTNKRSNMITVSLVKISIEITAVDNSSTPVVFCRVRVGTGCTHVEIANIVHEKEPLGEKALRLISA